MNSVTARELLSLAEEGICFYIYDSSGTTWQARQALGLTQQHEFARAHQAGPRKGVSSMPTLMELQNRLKGQSVVHVRLGSEEVLIADVRGKMRPGDFIEQKLRAALRTNASAVSAKSGSNPSLSN